MSTKREKSQYWDFTFNNYSDSDIETLSRIFSDKKNYLEIMYGKEIGESGTPHLQGYIKLAKRQYKSWLLNSNLNTGLLKDKISFRRCRNIKALKDYVVKDGNIVMNRQEVKKPDYKDKEEEFNYWHWHQKCHVNPYDEYGKFTSEYIFWFYKFLKLIDIPEDRSTDNCYYCMLQEKKEENW